jgi:hypothetical protein
VTGIPRTPLVVVLEPPAGDGDTPAVYQVTPDQRDQVIALRLVGGDGLDDPAGQLVLIRCMAWAALRRLDRLDPPLSWEAFNAAAMDVVVDGDGPVMWDPTEPAPAG